MIVLPVLLGIFSSGEAQDLTCPTGVVKPSSFYVVGASGGDIKVGTLSTLKILLKVNIARFFCNSEYNCTSVSTIVK